MAEHVYVAKAIDEALDALPRDVLSHVHGETKPFAGPGHYRSREVQWDTQTDAKAAWRWIHERLRLVLLALEHDERTEKVLSQMLPKPRLWPISEVDLSEVPVKERKKYERECRKHLGAEQKRLEGMRDQIRDSLENLEKERDEAESSERTEKQLAHLRDCLACIDHVVKEIRAKLRGEMSLVPAASTYAPWYPPAVNGAVEAAGLKDEKAREEWDKAIWGVPAVWLWVLWRNFHHVTDMPPIPGLPDWPGLDDLSGHDRQHFLVATALQVGPEVNHRPGKTLNFLKQALEDVRGRLKAADGGQAEAGEAKVGRVTAKDAMKTWHVSRATLKRYRDKGKLTSYRPPGAPENATYHYAPADLDRHFTRRKPPREAPRA